MNSTRGAKASLAYLIGHYPGFSLTFILREITLLRERGFQIRTVSINAAQPSQDGFTPAEEHEQRNTFYVKARGLFRIAGDHAACIVSRPARWLRGLVFALRLGRTDVRELVYHLFYFAEAVVIGEWMRRSGISHLHVHFAANTATVALITTRIYPFHYSISVHGPNEFYGVEQYRLPEKIQGAKFLCCIGQYCRSQVMKVSLPDQWHKFRIVPLGVDPDAFRPRDEVPENAEANILCVGRLVPEKGQAVLVAAAGLLLREGISLRVHFAGDGPSRPLLVRQAQELGIAGAITFHGSMNQERLRALFAIADMFVLPSFAEGIPVALMEAMAMEIPCISTFVAGIPELIESGRDGILVPPSDVQLLADAVRALVRDGGLRLRLGAAGRAKVMAKYSLPMNVGRLAEVFEEQLGQARNIEQTTAQVVAPSV